MHSTKGWKKVMIPVRDERGGALVVAILVVAVLSLLGTVFLSTARTENTIAMNEIKRTRAFLIAESGVEHARKSLEGLGLSAVLDGTTDIFPGGTTASLGGGTYTVEVTNNFDGAGSEFPRGTIPEDAPSGGCAPSATVDCDGIVVVTSMGNFMKTQGTVETVVSSPTPKRIKGAVTTNGPTATSGALSIDGRDHDINGIVITNNGTYGLFTAGTYTQLGNKVGGTDTTSTDHAPTNPGDPSVIVENSTEAMPTTPDDAVGLSEGDLKALAMNGANGSQYVTNPGTLTYPLSGVTYVEIPSGSEWFPPSIDGSGILIVHNSNTDAVIKNLNAGTFRGLLIADDIVHIHTDIIGAVISLTSSPSSGSVIGNGNGRILYSRQALGNAIAAASQSYSIRSWREL